MVIDVPAGARATNELLGVARVVGVRRVGVVRVRRVGAVKASLEEKSVKVSVTSTGNEVSEVRASVRHEVQTEVGVSPFGMASACASTAAGVLEAVASCEASWAAAVVGSAAGSLEVAGGGLAIDEVAGEDELRNG